MKKMKFIELYGGLLDRAKTEAFCARDMDTLFKVREDRAQLLFLFLNHLDHVVHFRKEKIERVYVGGLMYPINGGYSAINYPVRVYTIDEIVPENSQLVDHLKDLCYQLITTQTSKDWFIFYIYLVADEKPKLPPSLVWKSFIDDTPKQEWNLSLNLVNLVLNLESEHQEEHHSNLAILRKVTDSELYGLDAFMRC